MHHTTRPRQRRPRQLSPESGGTSNRAPPFRRQLVPRLDDRAAAPARSCVWRRLSFAPGSLALEQARAKLRRLGIDAEPEEVTLVIGATPSN